MILKGLQQGSLEGHRDILLESQSACDLDGFDYSGRHGTRGVPDVLGGPGVDLALAEGCPDLLPWDDDGHGVLADHGAVGLDSDDDGHSILPGLRDDPGGLSTYSRLDGYDTVLAHELFPRIEIGFQVFSRVGRVTGGDSGDIPFQRHPIQMHAPIHCDS